MQKHPKYLETISNTNTLSFLRPVRKGIFSEESCVFGCKGVGTAVDSGGADIGLDNP